MVSAIMAAAQWLELEVVELLKCSKLNSWQCFIHCYDNAFNLSVNDTMKGSAAMKDCIET